MSHIYGIGQPFVKVSDGDFNCDICKISMKCHYNRYGMSFGPFIHEFIVILEKSTNNNGSIVVPLNNVIDMKVIQGYRFATSHSITVDINSLRIVGILNRKCRTKSWSYDNCEMLMYQFDKPISHLGNIVFQHFDMSDCVHNIK